MGMINRQESIKSSCRGSVHDSQSESNYEFDSFPFQQADKKNRIRDKRQTEPKIDLNLPQSGFASRKASADARPNIGRIVNSRAGSRIRSRVSVRDPNDIFNEHQENLAAIPEGHDTTFDNIVSGAASPSQAIEEVEEENNLSTAHHTKIQNRVTWKPEAPRTEQDVLEVVSLLEKLNLKVTVDAAVRSVEEKRILVEGNKVGAQYQQKVRNRLKSRRDQQQKHKDAQIDIIASAMESEEARFQFRKRMDDPGVNLRNVRPLPLNRQLKILNPFKKMPEYTQAKHQKRIDDIIGSNRRTVV